MTDEERRTFEEFVAAQSLRLRQIAYALCGDPHTAEDLVQDALAKLAQRWCKVDDPYAYVRRIIYNAQVSTWRRKRRMREDLVTWMPDPEVSDAPASVDVQLDVLRALYRLGARQRTVLILKYYFDLPESEIATALDCSVGTVRSQASRGVARLRELAPELDHRMPEKEEA